MTQITRDQISLSDEEIEQLFGDNAGLGLSAAEGSPDLSYGLATEIDEFRKARKGWARPGLLETDKDGVFVVRDAAAVKGQRKRDIVLIRIGEFCAIHGMDQ